MMERRFDTNDFERSLKEQADKFFLIPSERVWRSIYNDLHPGSKWPSFAVGIVLLISLFWIGNTHKTTVPREVSTEVQKINVPAENTTQPVEYHSSNNEPAPVSQRSVDQTVLAPLAPVLPIKHNKEGEAGIPLLSANTRVLNPTALAPVMANVPGHTAGIHSDLLYNPLNGEVAYSPLESGFAKRSYGTAVNIHQDFIPVTTNNVTSSSETTTIKKQLSEKLLAANGDQKQAPESVGAGKKKKHRKAAWTFFVTPERSDVHFEGSNLNKSTSGIVASPYSSHNISTRERFGFQTGADVNYKLTKTIDLTSGFHLNYTGYNIMADLAHPSLATVTFRNSKGDLYTKNYISFYGNDGNGSLKIANYNMQFAIPVGLQWTLFEKDNVKVSVVSTVEPFLVLGSKAYILSGDGKKFVNDPDLVRKVNLNGNFGSVITFSSHKVDWKIGPSIRYQFLSTYHNIYPVREHLLNYGIRIGISKPE